MKILHVVPSFYPAFNYGGPIESVLRLCQHLSSQDNVVKVLTTDANGLRQVLDVNTDQESQFSANLLVRYCHRWFRHSASPTLFRLLPSYIRWADVVHLTGVYSFPTMPTLFWSNVLHKPLVWSPRGAIQRWQRSTRPLPKKIWEMVCATLCPAGATLHVTSEDEQRQSTAGFPRLTAALIPNGIEIPENPHRIESAQKILRLLYLGRIHPIKGIENLLAACKELNAHSAISWRLTVAGFGESSYVSTIKDQVQALGVSAQIGMPGEVSGEAKEAVFADADVVVVPSYSENFGTVVAEALARGVPVIAGSGTPWSRLEEKGCGLHVDNSPKSLCDAILRISTMPLRQMGMRGRGWMQEEFRWDIAAEKTLNLYQGKIDAGKSIPADSDTVGVRLG